MHTFGTGVSGVLAMVLVLAPVPAAAQGSMVPESFPEPPAFLEGIQSIEEIENLPPAQREEALEYLQTILPPGPGGLGALGSGSVGTPEGTVSCFDYYTFGSVHVELSAAIDSTVSGVPITFIGQLRNETRIRL